MPENKCKKQERICMKLCVDIDVISQEFSRLSWIWCLGNWSWNLWKTRRIEKQHRWRSFTSLSEVGGRWNSWDKVRRAKSCLGIVKHDGHDPSRNCIICELGTELVHLLRSISMNGNSNTSSWKELRFSIFCCVFRRKDCFISYQKR